MRESSWLRKVDSLYTQLFVWAASKKEKKQCVLVLLFLSFGRASWTPTINHWTLLLLPAACAPLFFRSQPARLLARCLQHTFRSRWLLISQPSKQPQLQPQPVDIWKRVTRHREREKKSNSKSNSPFLLANIWNEMQEEEEEEVEKNSHSDKFHLCRLFSLLNFSSAHVTFFF